MRSYCEPHLPPAHVRSIVWRNRGFRSEGVEEEEDKEGEGEGEGQRRPPTTP